LSDELLDIPVKRADGHETTLADYQGKVILVVNVASKCGLTVQYEGLEKLYEGKRDGGFIIAAFPANDFKGQEPGTDEEIVAFCTSTYDVQFPIFSKISVRGEEKHPLYQRLIASAGETIGDGPMRERLHKHGIETPDASEILWNFEKFLIGRDGRVAGRFAPDVTPDDPRLLAAVDRELARSA
jgi:glutathione peroxidase